MLQQVENAWPFNLAIWGRWGGMLPMCHSETSGNREGAKAGESSQLPQPASSGLGDRKSSASLTKKVTTSNRKLLPFLSFRASISFFVLKSIPCLQPSPSPPLQPQAQRYPQQHHSHHDVSHFVSCPTRNGGEGMPGQADLSGHQWWKH